MFKYVLNGFDTFYQPWTGPIHEIRINGEDVLIGYSPQMMPPRLRFKNAFCGEVITGPKDDIGVDLEYKLL